MKETLINRGSRGEIRIVNISCEWNTKLYAYVISRSTLQLGGKVTEQPDIIISKGKVNRTPTEQSTLEYESKIKNYLDKGYKNIKDFGYTSLDDFDPDKTLSNEKEDSNGAKKPMLCKKYDDVATSTFEKKHYCSRKLDGVRMMLRNDKGVLKTSSRGGGEYDIPSTYILSNPLIIKFLNKYPSLILDGELYKHGWTLQKISGICRKITLEEEHKDLQYWIYDIAGTDKTFEKRLEILQEMKSLFGGSSQIIICDHIETNSWSDIERLHNKWVKDGYEGCVIRNPDKEYGYGKKDARMIKVKMFKDLEATILSIVEGLRPEDFVFAMKLNNGIEFEAKPMGTREIRQEYRDNIKNLIGKKGTVKFFEFSPDGRPLLPIFKSVRTEEDLD